MRRLIDIAVLLAIALPLGCRRQAAERTPDDRPLLTVSIEPQRYLLEQIAGPDFEVRTIMGKSADPENYDPSMGAMADAEKSDLLFVTGLNPFEMKVSGRLGYGKVVDCSEGVELLTGTHSHHSHHSHDHGHCEDCHHHDGEETETPDPHIWASLRNCRIMAANMLKALQRKYPERSDDFARRFAKLDARLDSADHVITRRLAPARGNAFVMWHPALSYFARDYGLTQMSVGTEGKELSIRNMTESVSDALRMKASLLVIQPSDDTARSNSLARQASLEVTEVNTLSYYFIGQLTALADKIIETEKNGAKNN